MSYRVGKATGHIVFKGGEKEIGRAAVNPFLKAINQRIRSRLPGLIDRLKPVIVSAIMECDEVQTVIRDDDTRGQMGLPE